LLININGDLVATYIVDALTNYTKLNDFLNKLALLRGLYR